MTGVAPAFRHRHCIRVRFGETDAMGVVYYGNYLTYFEVGRVEYLRASGTEYRALEEAKISAAVTAAQVRYAAPARFDDELTICTRVAEMGKVRFKFEYEIWREADHTLIVSGSTDHALLHHETLRPVRLPDEIRLGIERFEAGSAR
jgi:acyl-CoA thioester hydrolase